MLQAKDKSVKALTGGVEYLLKKNKVDYIKGTASFASPTSIDVALLEGGNTQVEAKNVIIATGSEVTPFPGIEIDEKQIVSSTGALELSEVPKKMVVIGAGVIGLELGSVWSRLGANVEVVEFLGAIGGAGMDAEVAKNFQKILGKQGLKFNLNTKVLGATKKDGVVHLEVEGAKDGKKSTVRCVLSARLCSALTLSVHEDRGRRRLGRHRPPPVHRGPQPRQDWRRGRQPRPHRHRLAVQHVGQERQVHWRRHFCAS